MYIADFNIIMAVSKKQNSKVDAVSFAAWEATTKQLLARVVFLVSHSFRDLICGFGHVVLRGAHIGLYVIQHAALLLHQVRHLVKEFMNVLDSALQLQQLLVPVLDLVEGRSGSPPLQEEVIREDVPLARLDHLVDLLHAHLLAHDLSLPLDAGLAVLPLGHLGLVELRHGLVEGRRQGDVL